MAYGTVLQEQRKTLHERTAQAIEGRYPTSLDDHYSELAHHYSHSDNVEKAVEYLQLAGQQAVQRAAYADAVSYFTAALELLPILPDTPERLRQELRLLVGLAIPFQVTKGYGGPEVKELLSRAHELCQILEDDTHQRSVLWSLYASYLVQADLAAAQESGEQLVALGHRLQDPTILMEGHCVMTDSLFHRGHFVAAREHAATKCP